MTKLEWHDKNWLPSTHDLRPLNVMEEAWISRFEDPSLELDEATGKLQHVFSGRLRHSARVIRYVTNVAAWDGAPKSSTHGVGLVELRRKAFEAVMFSLLGDCSLGGAQTPAIVQVDPSLITDVLQILVKLPRHPDGTANHPERANKLGHVMTGLLSWCLEHGMRDSEQRTEKTLEIMQVIDANITQMVRLIIKRGLKVEMSFWPHRPSPATENRRRLTRRALEIVARENGQALNRPGYWELVRYSLELKAYLHFRIQDSKDEKEREELKAELASIPTF